VAASERLEVKQLARGRLRLRALGGVLAAALLVALVWRVATEPAPALVVQRTLAPYVRFPGTEPALAWPREGQAAVEVGGLGSFGTAGAQTPAPIASVAKVMTAYLTLRAHPLAAGTEGFQMTVTPGAVAEERRRAALGQSTVVVRAGERLSELQALRALLLPSANNVAIMLAEHDPGGVAGFVARMNATARMLGMDSTTYTDPSGYRESTVSTAADQLRLARAAMHNRVFAAIVAEPTAQLPVAGTVTNYNGLLGGDGYVGVKTGSDRAAGGCLMFAKRIAVAGRRLTVLGVVLGQREGSPVEAALASGARLGDSAAAAVRVATVLPAGTNALAVASADGQRVTGVTAGPLRAVGWSGLSLAVRTGAGMPSGRLRAGDRVGTVGIADAGPTPVLASGSLRAASLGWRLAHLL